MGCKLINGSLLWIIFPILFICAGQAQAQGTVSVMSEGRWHRGVVDNAHMNREIAKAAEQYKQYAPIARIAFYDVGFPKDKAEFEALNGYGILLVSALSQDGAELPVKRAFVRSEGVEYNLKELIQISAKDPDPNSQSTKTFGPYRVDSLFLFPLFLRSLRGELLVDFTKNRTDMRLAVFDGSTPDAVKNLPATKPVAGKANDAAMKTFLGREYPGYKEK